MHVYTNRPEISAAVAKHKKNGAKIGFVPTMGALHRGHASLFNFALKNCDIVVVSIFVNPTQFNNPRDLETYPRDLQADLEFLESINPELLVFTPSTTTIYGSKVESIDYNFDGLDQVMEGAFRPGHFEGVATVLNYLFEIVNPDFAFFGEKDYQQLQIINKLVAIEALSVKIIGCPISRHEDGLAESSRNKRLTQDQRNASPFIYKTLTQAKALFNDQTVDQVQEFVKDQFKDKEHLQLEYFEIANASTLTHANTKKESEKYRAFIAVFAGEVRLIDNIALN
ncbi:pantoate--beta-alanine ligase [Leeuwenhoekiella marinoflava]|uniref:Pantothenate synthetase n=2 Tax=Leeuwenhoekiella marinoflava TaxID=988 RepID=A0A4Q0PRE3_9FLAO|nr:pantoate--beta-alanine ligase [Leeuwenhoekiella marinoflava]RXG33176.1 pantothenate synthetase [Leeuwenhoekiella marinoflava]SHE41314.1 pantothenate synthetase [Leeuwenhoekiella marinoflava DSM 3653]